MKAIDTNILARFFLEIENNPKSVQQKIIATKILSKPVYVSLTVILEFEWVMRGVYKLDKPTILNIYRALQRLPTVTIEDKAILDNVLLLFEQGLDFADALHLVQTLSLQGFITFDNNFYKRAKKLGYNIALADNLEEF